MKTDYTRYRLSLMENIVFGMGYLVAAAVVCIIFYDSFLPLILMLPTGVYVRRLFEEYKRKRRQQELYLQFKDMVQALAASLSVGYSFENAFIAAHEELTRTYGKDALIVRELVLIMHEIRLHKNIEDVLADFGERSGIREIHNFSQLVAVAKRTGGNMVQIMKTTAAGIARKVEVEMEIATMIAAKRYEQRIMLVIPFLIIGYLRMVNQSYICILYEGVAGRNVMTLCLLAGIISYFWSRKLINIGV